MRVNKRKIIERILKSLARRIIRKYQPLIIGITGSVGKSTTKEAVALVLSQAYAVRKTEGNYNNEIGIPLTILGVHSGGSSWLGWLGIIATGIRLLLIRVQYPEVLVLEMGIDRPGDMTTLMSFVPVNIGIVTQVSSSHLEFFGSLGAIAKEKGKLITHLPEDGFAILNADDKRVVQMRNKTRAKTMTYGFDTTAEVRADHILFHRDVKHLEGLSFKLNYEGKSMPVRLPHIVAEHHIHAVLSAIAVGVALRMNLVDITSALEALVSMPGRLRALPGRDNMVLLDDTYNASPASMRAGLATLHTLLAPRKVVIFGDMLELGTDTEKDHADLAEDVITSGATLVVLIGAHMRYLYERLLTLEFPRRQIFWLADPVGAERFCAEMVRAEDLVFIKGSQGMRLERITATLLADPMQANALLCRQSPEWRRKPFVAPSEWREKEASIE